MAVTSVAPPTAGTSSNSTNPGAPPSGSPPPAPNAPRNENLRLRVAHWMEDHFGRAYVPIAMAGGAAVGGLLGAFTLGPIGAIGGALAGGMLGGVLVFAG